MANRYPAVVVFAPPPGYTSADAARSWLASPFMELLVEQMRHLEIEVVLEDDAKLLTDAHSSALVSFNRTAASLRAFSDVPRSRRILSLWEPPSVAPRLYSRRNCSWFGTRVAFSRIWAYLAAGHACFWPQLALQTASDCSETPRLPLAVSVVSNKRSADVGSLYRLRRQVLSAGAAMGLVDVYGRGWNSLRFELKSASRSVAGMLAAGRRPSLVSAFGGSWSPMARWRGAVESTVGTMRNYEVAIVIENEPTYVSEKVFDAFAAGCVPVYVGPPLSDYGIPQQLVVQAPPDAGEILARVDKLLQSDVHDRRNVIRDFLSGPDVAPWRPESVARDFASRIVLDGDPSITEDT